MEKHAYLIIANRNFEQLQSLVTLLDDSRNDIYILIDNKAKVNSPQLAVQHSRLKLIPRINIYWGDFSQVQAELDLIKVATKQGDYSFYHLLSGLDLPLANQDYIHTFFNQHSGENFLTYSAQVSQSDLEVRMMKHHLSKHYRDRRVFYRLFNKIEGDFLKLAAKRHPRKINHEIEFGSNWFSISHDLATTVVQSEQWITSTFSHGFLVDELFIPAVINHASVNFKIYHDEKVHDKPDELQGNLRYINWWDGSPYTWRSQDFSKLKAAKEMGHLFARKFDSSVDKKIITMVIDQLVNDPTDDND